MIEEVIRNFPKQFAWQPEIENAGMWRKFERFLVAGVGGSGLPGDILKMLHPSLDLIVHKDYDLPQLSRDALEDRMVVTVSYSGNTEEPINVFKKATEARIPTAVISRGGRLLELAKKQAVPYVQLPDEELQPRMGLGYSIRALLKITGQENLLQETQTLSFQLNVQDLEQQGKNVAAKLMGKIPVIYSSSKNAALAFSWKLKFTETGKVPAFWNVFPELNHSEMNGFDPAGATKPLIEQFAFLFVEDDNDHPKIQKRMEVLEKMYRKRGLQVEIVSLAGSSIAFEIFSSLLLADWTSYYTARMYGVDPEHVPMVEEFKKLMSG